MSDVRPAPVGLEGARRRGCLWSLENPPEEHESSQIARMFRRSCSHRWSSEPAPAAQPRVSQGASRHSGVLKRYSRYVGLAIREQEVVALLLVDGWHEVEPGSFYIDAYEYIHDDGSVSAGGIGVGFHAEDAERGEMAGPLSSVLAVRIVR